MSSRLDAARASTLLGTVGLLAGLGLLAGPVHASAGHEPRSCHDDEASSSCQGNALVSIVCGASTAEAADPAGAAIIVHVDGDQLVAAHDRQLIELAEGLATHACRPSTDDDGPAVRPCGGRPTALPRPCAV